MLCISHSGSKHFMDTLGVAAFACRMLWCGLVFLVPVKRKNWQVKTLWNNQLIWSCAGESCIELMHWKSLNKLDILWQFNWNTIIGNIIRNIWTVTYRWMFAVWEVWKLPAPGDDVPIFSSMCCWMERLTVTCWYLWQFSVKLTRKKETFIFTQWIRLTRLFTSHLAIVYYWWGLFAGELPPTCSHEIMVAGLLCLGEFYRDLPPVESTVTSLLMISLIWADIWTCYMRSALSWFGWNYVCYNRGFCNRKWTMTVDC